jgi:Sec-independent protein secretion pathway component TatC
MDPLNGHIPKAALVSNTGVDENVYLGISLSALVIAPPDFISKVLTAVPLMGLYDFLAP